MKQFITILLASLLMGCQPQKAKVSQLPMLIDTVLCVLSETQVQVSHQRGYRKLSSRIDGIYIPRDVDEAIDSLDVFFSAEEKRYIADSLSLEDFCVNQHFDGWGMWMRNEWGLWNGSRLQAYFLDKRIMHPDDMSNVILEAYYMKKIKGQEYIIEEGEEPEMVSSNVSDQSRKSENKIEFDGETLKVGDMLYFQYPYGCSTLEEQEMWLEKRMPRGQIVAVASLWSEVKIRLLETASPYGVIVFDGDIVSGSVLKRDFNHFEVHTPNRFYMQKGDELWFDVDFDFWDVWKIE